MTFLRAPASWVTGIAGHFPVAVQPGIAITQVILLLWVLISARRPLWNALLRPSCLVIDTAVGLLLLPEFVWTRAQRAQGGVPGPLTQASGHVAERVLDAIAGIYEAHPFVRPRRRPPIALIVIIIIVSIADFAFLHKTPPNAGTRLADTAWHFWVQFRSWSQGT